MLQTIRPSEMCGIQNFRENYEQAQVIEVRRASTVRILSRPVSMVGAPSRPTSEVPALPTLSHKSSYSIDVQRRDAREDAAQARPPSYQQRSTAYASVLPGYRDIENPGSSVKKKRDAVMGFLALRERPTGQRQTLPSAKRSSTVSQAGHATPQVTVPLRRRPPNRPTLSCFIDGPHEPRLTVGTLSSRPVSLAANRPLVSKWTPSSSSSEVSLSAQADRQDIEHLHQGSVNASFLDDTEPWEAGFSADTSFLESMRHSPAAAYLQEGPYETRDCHAPQQQQRLSSRTIRPALAIRNEPEGTCWYSDTETDDASVVQAPVVTETISDQYSEWLPAAEEVLAVSEDENWPLPRQQSQSYVPLTNHDTIATTRKVSHVSTLSAGTVSSLSTIISPTFSHGRTDSTSASTILSPTWTETTRLEPFLIPQSRELDTASIAPSEVSAQWTKSPKERLGLGSVVRKSQVLPWEEQAQPRRLQKPINDLTRRKSRSNRFSALMGWRKDVQ